MFGRSIGFTAVCALAAANAVVIPSGFGSSDNAPSAPRWRHEEDFRPPTTVDPKRQRIEIPCASCSFQRINIDLDEDGEGVNDVEDDRFWIQGDSVSNNLALDFSISDDGRRLQLDGEPIYPSQEYRAAAHGGRPIYVTQLPADRGSGLGGAPRVSLEVTAFGLVISEAAASPRESDVRYDDRDDKVRDDVDHMVRIQLQLSSLERTIVRADDLAIDLLRTSEGELLILRLEDVPQTGRASAPPPLLSPPRPSPPPPSPFPYTDDVKAPLETPCPNLPASACRIKQAVESKISALRTSKFGLSRPSCPGMMHGGHPPPPPPPPHPKFPEFDILPRPPHHHSGSHDDYYGHHRHHHHHHHFLHSLARGVIAVLIPVMAGITTGLLVSLVGLMMGRVVGCAWAWVTGGRRRRGGHRRRRSLYKRVPGAEGRKMRRRRGEDDDDDDEEEPLPVYEEAPPYEERASRAEGLDDDDDEVPGTAV